MTKPVLLAGLLGGVLGAVFAFALARTFPATPKLSPPPPPSEGRQFADDLIAKLKAGKSDEFTAKVRNGFPELNDEDFNQAVRQPLLTMRENFGKAYGQPSEFEFVRETAISPSVVRFAYLEKFPHGCVVWVIACYDGPQGWQVLGFRHLKLEAAFDMLR